MKILLLSASSIVLLGSSTISMENSRWNAVSYQNNAEPQYGLVQESIDNITHNFNGNEFILDIGCGPGKKTVAFAQKVPQGMVYGIDSSLDMVKSANKQYGNENLKFLHLDAESFKFAHQFNLITAFSCLHWIKNQKKVLKKISKNLKPGGIFFATMAFEQPRLHQFINILAETGLTSKWQKYMPNELLNENTRTAFLNKQVFPQTQDSITELLERSLLKPVELNVIEERTILQKEKFIQWLMCWIIGFPMLDKIPSKMLEEFTTDVVDNYINILGLDKGLPIPYSSYILVIHAKKLT